MSGSVRTLKEYREQALKDGGSNGQTLHSSVIGHDIKELEIRIQRLEYIIQEILETKPQIKNDGSAPPAYQSPILRGPMRPLF